jgi:hypothetical protein
MPLAGQDAATLRSVVALAPLRGQAQQARDLPAALLVATDKPIDRLVADVEAAFESKPAADLVGTEAFAIVNPRSLTLS